jgi:protein SCO1
MSASLPLEAPDAGATDDGRIARVPQRVLALVSRPRFWVVAVIFGIVGLTVPIVNQLRRPAPRPLPVLGTLPAFQLTGQDGRPFGSAQLKGRVWAAGFIFTRCPTICPALTSTMAKIQRRARGIQQTFHLVSFSVDPAHDTPGRLTEFAHQHNASPQMWTFVTGPIDAMKQTVEDGLKIAMGASQLQGEQDFASIFHGTHFVLVDQELRIRGYYDSTAADVEDRILEDAAMLINRGN